MQEMNSEAENRSAFNPMVIMGIAALVVIVGAGVLFAMNRNQASDSAMETTVPGAIGGDSDLAAPGALIGDEEVRTITMEAGSFYFAPDAIRVNVGERVRLVMTSADMMHDFNIDELGVRLPITQAGETSTVEFVANQAGTFEYYCSVGDHRANGQVGTLIVE